MRKLFTLLVIATLLFTSCSSDDSTVVRNIVPVEQVNESIYKIVDTNVNQLTISRFREGVWETKPEWVNQRMLTVMDKDILLITSSGEQSTEEKRLYVKYEGDNDNGIYRAANGSELRFDDVIGKPY